MIVVKYTSDKCPWRQVTNSTGFGWRRVGACKLYTTSHYSPGLAHDTLDHWDMASIEDEVMAHASECWMRVGWKFNIPVHWGDPYWWDKRGTYQVLRMNINPGPAYMSALPKAKLAYCEPQNRLPLVVEKRLQQALKGMRIPYYKDWFRKGYRRTAERFDKIGKARACILFQDLCDFFEELHTEGIMPGKALTMYIDNETGNWSHVIDPA